MEESSLRNQTIYSFSYWCRMVSNLCCFHFYRTHVYNVSVTRTNYTILHNFTFQLEFRMERPISIFFFFFWRINSIDRCLVCLLASLAAPFLLSLFFSVCCVSCCWFANRKYDCTKFMRFQKQKLDTTFFVAWTQYDNNWNTIISIEMRSQL